MTGMLMVEMSLLSSRSTSRPDLVGNARSNRTASGACSCARLRLSSPFFASTTANPSPASSAVVIVRVHGSSSITSTVRWPVAATVMLSLLSAQRPMLLVACAKVTFRSQHAKGARRPPGLFYRHFCQDGCSGKGWGSAVRDVVRRIVARLGASDVRELRSESLVVGSVTDVILVVAVAEAVVRLLVGEAGDCL